MNENAFSSTIVNCCYHIHKKLGPGLLESVYEEVLCYELLEAGLSYTRQTNIPVYYNELILEIGFRADIIVKTK